jgi:hypothetical protein
MWLLVVGALVLVIVIALVGDALGYNTTNKPGLSIQEDKLERDRLVNRWFSGKHRPNDEKRMFEEFYEGDVDTPEWD